MRYRLWCETCEGTGEVYMEAQHGVTGSGGIYNCPDCDARGYTFKTDEKTGQPLENEEIDESIWGINIEDANEAGEFERSIARAAIAGFCKKNGIKLTV